MNPLDHVPAALRVRPPLARGLEVLLDRIDATDALPVRVRTAVRHRVATMLRLGVDGPVPGAGDPSVDVAVAVAEQFVLSVHDLDDATVARARAQLGDRGLVALMTTLAVADGFGRFAKVLGADPGAGGP